MEEWIGRLRHQATECEYNTQYDRQLKEHFVQDSNDDEAIIELIRELALTTDGTDNTSVMALS